MTGGAEPRASFRGDSRFRWGVCVVLLLATVLNYLNRQVFSLTAEKVIAEFHTDKEGYGRLVAAFRYPYAAVQFFGGWLVDVFGPRLVFPSAVAVWSAATLLTARTRSFGGLAACRAMLGAGEAYNWPCALATTERLVEPRDKPFANGIFNSGTALGAILAPVVVTLLVTGGNWRSPFFLVGALGAVWIALWMIVTRADKKRLAGGAVVLADVPRQMLRIGCRREFWMLATAAVVINGVSYIIADWIPLYLKVERGFGFALGNSLSILAYVGLDLGNLLTGFSVRRAIAGGMAAGRARTAALVACCACMSCSVAVGWVSSRYLALGGIVVAAVGVAGFLVIYLTAVQDLEPAHVGVTSGMLGGLGNLIYGFLSPFIGRLWDRHDLTLLFALTGILPWLAYVSIAPVMRKPASPAP